MEQFRSQEQANCCVERVVSDMRWRSFQRGLLSHDLPAERLSTILCLFVNDLFFLTYDRTLLLLFQNRNPAFRMPSNEVPLHLLKCNSPQPKLTKDTAPLHALTLSLRWNPPKPNLTNDNNLQTTSPFGLARRRAVEQGFRIVGQGKAQKRCEERAATGGGSERDSR